VQFGKEPNPRKNFYNITSFFLWRHGCGYAHPTMGTGKRKEEASLTSAIRLEGKLLFLLDGFWGHPMKY
jgi:hypothetical protein